MAILFVDGCDLYGSDADIQHGGWALSAADLVEAVTDGGRFGGGSIRCEYTHGVTRGVTIAASTLCCQFAFKHEQLSEATDELFFRARNNGGSQTCASLEITVTGAIRAKNSSGALVGTSVTGVVNEQVWHYCEVKVVCADSGSILVKIDGTEVLNLTGVDTKPGTATDIDSVGFFGASDSSSLGVVFDDFILIDDSGSNVTDLIGDRRIYTLLPDTDTATVDFSSQPSQSVGDVHTVVDDPVPGSDDGDSTYIYSATPNDEILFDFEDLPVNPASIEAVCVTLTAKKDDAGARSMAALLSADVKTAGATFNPGTDYEQHRTIWEQTTEAVPASWTGTKVNAAQAGTKLVS